MSLKARVIAPVMTLAAAAMLAACGGNEVAPAPVSLPTSTPPAAPTAAPTQFPTVTPSPVPSPTPAPTATPLEEIVSVQCGISPRNEVIFYVNSKEQWRKPIGIHMPDYSRRLLGSELSQSGFECVSPVNDSGVSFGPVYDKLHNRVFAFGQDKSAAFPAELTMFSATSGAELGYMMHPGNLKGIVPLGMVATPSGSRDIAIVIGVSNVSSLVQQASAATGKRQPYVPVALAVELPQMNVLGYLPLGYEGQPLFAAASKGDGVSGATINYTLDVDGKRGPALTFAVNQLFVPYAADLAAKLTGAGAFK